MGWGRMLLLGNVGQQLDIQDTQQTIGHLVQQLRNGQAADRDTAHTVEKLAAENAELKLYLAAIIRLLVTKGTITPAEIEQVVREVDRSDGAVDGRFGGPLSPR